MDEPQSAPVVNLDETIERALKQIDRKGVELAIQRKRDKRLFLYSKIGLALMTGVGIGMLSYSLFFRKTIDITETEQCHPQITMYQGLKVKYRSCGFHQGLEEELEKAYNEMK